MPSLKEYRELGNQLVDATYGCLEVCDWIKDQINDCSNAEDFIAESNCHYAVENMHCTGIIDSLDRTLLMNRNYINGTPLGDVSRAVMADMEEEGEPTFGIVPKELKLYCVEKFDSMVNDIINGTDDINKAIKYAIASLEIANCQNTYTQSLKDAIKVITNCNSIKHELEESESENIQIEKPTVSEYVAAIGNLSHDGYYMDPNHVRAVLHDAVERELNKSSVKETNEHMKPILEEARREVSTLRMRKVIDEIIDKIEQNEVKTSIDNGLDVA